MNGEQRRALGQARHPARGAEGSADRLGLSLRRDHWLSNRIVQSDDDIVDHCCAAWNKLIDQPWKIISIGLRDWAHPS